MTAMSGPQVAELATAAGFKGNALLIALAVAYAESSWDATAVGGPNTDGTYDRGLWQINDVHKLDKTRLVGDPAYNAAQAYRISRGGTSWTPWTTFKSGAYSRHLQRARDAAAGRTSGAPSPEEFQAQNPAAVDVTAQYTNVVLTRDLPPAGAPVITPGSGLGNDKSLIGGALDLSTNEVTQLRLEYLETDSLFLTNLTAFQLYAAIRYRNLPWRITSRELSGGQGGPRFTITAQPWGVYRLRQAVPFPMSNISPSQYLEQAAKASGMRAVVQPSAARASIGPAQVDDDAFRAIGGRRAETCWELGQRLARELGRMLFEVNNTLYFGEAAWLAAQAPTVQLLMRGAAPAAGLGPARRFIGIPTLRRSRARSRAGKVQFYGDLTVRGTLPAADAAGLRPVLAVALRGATGMVSDKERLLITRLTYDVVDTGKPVDIELGDFPAPVVGTNPDADPATTAAPAAPAPTGGSTGRVSYEERDRVFGRPGDRARTSTYRTPWGVTVTVHQLVLPRFKAACEEASRSAAWKPRRIDSYNVRRIAGSSSWSLHSYGLAWDMFATAPGVAPPGGVLTPVNGLTAEFAAIFKKHGFFWGKDFSSYDDVPHIEWAGGRP